MKADTWVNRKNLTALGPRFAVTWSPNRRTVIRSGHAMAFDTFSSFQVTAVATARANADLHCDGRRRDHAGVRQRAECSLLAEVELLLPTSKPFDFLTPPAQLYTNAVGMTSFDPNLKLPTVHQFSTHG